MTSEISHQEQGMRHVTIEDIVNYTSGEPTDVEKLTFENHVTTCNHCGDLNQEFKDLLSSLREDSACEPPVDAVQWSINLFQPVIQPQSKGPIRKIIAALV